jgi:magnesium chelatase family protein
MPYITINLAPGDLRKAGPYYDPPIAVAILAASGQVELNS